MPTENPRLSFMLTHEMKERIIDYQYEHKCKNTSQALLELIQLGLGVVQVEGHTTLERDIQPADNGLACRIKEARKRAGLTQSQVAEEIGVARSTYTGYEIGNAQPDIHTLLLIMNVLGVDANFLFQDGMAIDAVTTLQFTEDEIGIIACYRLLNDEGKRSLLMQAQMHARYEAFQVGM